MIKLSFEKIIETLNFEKKINNYFDFEILKENPNKYISMASINSNCEKENFLFVALKGKNTDATNFLIQAFENGASYFLVDKNNWNDKDSDFKTKILEYKNLKNIIICNDVEKAFQILAKQFLILANEKNPNLEKIILTGSVGKTTTKDVLSFVLKKIYGEEKVLSTKGNLNNQLGVPITIFELTGEEEICIFEVGINHKNEMDNLSSIINPNIGIILNIGKSHLEFLKDLDGVLDAKWELVNNISKNGSLILNLNDEKLMQKLKNLKNDKNLNLILFGEKTNIDSEIKNKFKNFILGNLNEINENFSMQKIEIKNNKFDIKILGKAGLYASLACFSVCKALKSQIADELITKYLSIFNERSKMRFEIQKINGISVINDSYNANPTSMAESLSTFEKLIVKNGEKIVIIGDMLELGEASKSEHKNIGKIISKMNFKHIFLYGEESFYIFEDLKTNHNNIFWTKDKNEITEKINNENILKNGDFLFLKGSRGMKLESILENINCLKI